MNYFIRGKSKSKTGWNMWETGLHIGTIFVTYDQHLVILKSHQIVMCDYVFVFNVKVIPEEDMLYFYQLFTCQWGRHSLLVIQVASLWLCNKKWHVTQFVKVYKDNTWLMSVCMCVCSIDYRRNISNNTRVILDQQSIVSWRYWNIPFIDLSVYMSILQTAFVITVKTFHAIKLW